MPLKAGTYAVSLCALLIGCRATEQAEQLYTERTVTFHAILVDEYKVIGQPRVFDILLDAGMDHDRGLNLNLGSLGKRLAGGGNGDDVIQAGGLKNVMIYGGPGDDKLVGGPDSDILFGDPGRDILDAGYGNDILVIDEFDEFDGGPGQDRAIYVGTADVDIDISDHDIEIFNSGPGDDFIRTDLTKEAAMHGGPGRDWIYGGWGRDWLAGGKGRDVLEGGYQDDTYLYRRGDGRDTINDYSFNSRTDTLYDIYSDGSKRNYREREVRLKEHAGQDRILFGTGIRPHDLMVRFDGLDLLVAIRNPATPSGSFETQDDQIRLSNWGDECDRLEYFEFQDGTTVDLARLVDLNGLSDRGDVLDLATLKRYGNFAFDKQADPAVCDPQEKVTSIREIDPPTD